MTAAFISFSYKDRALAHRVADLLNQAGLPAWMSDKEPTGGEELDSLLKTKIQEASCLVLVLTPHANEARYVPGEVRHALAISRRIIILSLRDTKPGKRLPKELEKLIRIPAGASLTERAKRDLVRDVGSIHRARAPVVTMLNLKGGVGKTTLAANIFGCMHEKFGKSVLLIDFDPQHNLTQLVPSTAEIDNCWRNDRSILSIFEASRLSGLAISPADDLMRMRFDGLGPSPEQAALPLKPRQPGFPRLDLVLGHFGAIKYTLPGAYAHREALRERLQRFLRDAQRVFDVIVFDVNPGSTALTEMAVQESTHILAPFRPERYSEKGLEMLRQLMREVYKPRYQPKITAILNGDDRARPFQWPEVAMRSCDHVMNSRIGFSVLLQAQASESGVYEGDFTRGLTYRNNRGYAKLIRSEIEAASEEYLNMLLEAPNA